MGFGVDEHLDILHLQDSIVVGNNGYDLDIFAVQIHPDCPTRPILHT